MKPKITVITVVLNEADKLEATIESVLTQSYDDLDYLVIDGGSTDGTLGLIRSYAGRLKHWLSEPDTGVYDAMNKGWSLAAPDSHVIFLGAGDQLISLPEKFWGEEQQFVIFYGNVLLDDGRSFRARTGFWLKLYNSLHHQALLIPKRLHPAPPFDLVFPLYADFDFNQRLSKAGACFRFEPQLSAYAAPGGLTRDMHLDELSKIVRKNYGPFWGSASRFGFLLARMLPIVRRVRPIS